jgi:hypothetical protein
MSRGSKKNKRRKRKKAQKSASNRATPDNVEALARQAEQDNWELRAYLKQQVAFTDEELDAFVFDISRSVWDEIDCTTCARCCKELRPGLSDTEQERLAERLSISVEELRGRYLERTSTDDPEHEPGEQCWRIAGSPCPFLRDDRCSVYEDRPAECRGYPYLFEADFSFRMLGMLDRTFTCPIVYEVFEELKRSLP